MRQILIHLTACLILITLGGCDMDVEKIVEIEGKEAGTGDGNLTWYRSGQVTAPAPPTPVVVDDNVALGYIVVFRPGPSAAVPSQIHWHLRGCTDETLPDLIGQEPLVYVPSPPPPPGDVIPEKHCVFDPISCTALFTEGAYAGGDYYYAVIIVNVGMLPEGSHEFCMTIDPDDDVFPEDDIGNVKTRKLTVDVASMVYAASLQRLD